MLLELVQSAQREIVIISFAAFRIPDALRALKLCATPGVGMHFVLESEEESDGWLRQNGSVAFRSLVGTPAASYRQR